MQKALESCFERNLKPTRHEYNEYVPEVLPDGTRIKYIDGSSCSAGFGESGVYPLTDGTYLVKGFVTCGSDLRVLDDQKCNSLLEVFVELVRHALFDGNDCYDILRDLHREAHDCYTQEMKFDDLDEKDILALMRYVETKPELLDRLANFKIVNNLTKIREASRQEK